MNIFLIIIHKVCINNIPAVIIRYILTRKQMQTEKCNAIIRKYRTQNINKYSS